MKTLKHIFRLVLLISLNMQAQIINIPDANFKIKLLSGYSTNLQGQPVSIDANQNGEIEVTEAQNIIALGTSFQGANISDLTGLEYFINLKNILLANNQISEFNFPTLTLLVSLYLGFNPISTFDMSNHPHLKQIYIHDTQIAFINFPPSNILEYFGSGNQPLTAIDAMNSTNLKSIMTQNTNVSKINIKNTNINFNDAGMLWDCWQNIPLTYICCDAEDVPALTTFSTNCGHNLSAITIDTTNTCALSQGVVNNYGIKIYPNPSTGIFNLNLPAVFNAAVQVFNTLGQKVFETSIKNEQNVVLDLAHLQKGLYVLKVENEDGEKFEEKIIVN